MADAPTQGPPSAGAKAFDDGPGMAYPDGSGVPAGIPESDFRHPSWDDYLTRSRPGDPRIDPGAVRSTDDSATVDRGGEFYTTPWNRRKQPDRSA